MALKKRYPKVAVGFMDHSIGNGEQAFQLPLIALGAGISCIEKHITLDYLLEIEDYISALSIDRFGHFVRVIKNLEPALGSENLNLSDKEVAYKARAGKVAVANSSLKVGDVISAEDIGLKRVGLEPSDNYISQVEFLVGKTLLSPVEKDSPFLRSAVE
jgi:N,N'-diacetyllegionaminate synthase